LTQSYKGARGKAPCAREADVVPELRLRLRTANSDNAPNLYLRVLPRQELVGRTRVPILNTVGLIAT